ncbi:MAG TPA: putative toxin-antitoxin system toxin component, PIN family [Granulicella sp.]|jgi:putative PIN family toxin of toxin-antitoxin system|nr:putative toxin-antitoxin system toxin component, PIN family [Granulicella sp.]
MIRIRRVILDTSTLVSAALRIGSVPHQALLKALASCDVCASAETLAELEQVLDREKFDRYLDCELRRSFVAVMRRHVHLFAVQDADREAVEPPCRDPKDNQFLALALAAEADALVSSDEDLLVLHPWRGIAIVTPAEFLARTEIPQ